MAKTTEAKDQATGGMMVPLGIGLGAAILSAAGAFFLVQQGLLPLPLPPREAVFTSAEPKAQREGPDTDFVALTPLIVTLGEGDALRQLQMTAQLEVAPDAVDSVQLLTPRVVDVLNTYLRAVDSTTVEDPAAMLRMRAQMLRRVQVVTGDDMVRDLLIAEFILR